ncbi:hypothetical protein AB6A40_000533 [Gnathostoma spinigerum]|uniref:Uncharacterized protein n=1 Tax=Gnathostoma spinigerum TaxID=75299 RepID=A0ABD6E6P8_9BILA
MLFFAILPKADLGIEMLVISASLFLSELDKSGKEKEGYEGGGRGKWGETGDLTKELEGWMERSGGRVEESKDLEEINRLGRGIGWVWGRNWGLGDSDGCGYEEIYGENKSRNLDEVIGSSGEGVLDAESN